MGTLSKNTAKTAAVMNLISRRSAGENPALSAVSDSDTTGQPAAAHEQIEYIDIDRIDDDPRNFYELSGLDELAANIELLGLQQPIRVRPGEEPGRYVIVSGHRRRAAVRQLVMEGHGELREIQCIVERNQESAALQELRLIMANSDTRKLTSFELGKQAERVNDLLYQLQEEEGVEFPGRMRDHVAEACKISKSKLARLSVIQKNLAKPWWPAYEKGKLPEATAYALAQMPAERQQVIFDGLKKNGEYPASMYEHEITRYGKHLAQTENIQCTTYGNGPCLNREAMQRRIMSKDSWHYNDCRRCCDKCSELAKCKYACPMLADKVKRLKADAKAQRQQERQAREDRMRPTAEAIQGIWQHFVQARTAAGKSVEECYRAAGMEWHPLELQKAVDEHERLEAMEGRFTDRTDLPYVNNDHFYAFRIYIKIADFLGVSLDYLLCRTDDPMGFSPKLEGQLVFNGWMPGGTLPGVPCDVVADFDLAGTGHTSRLLCRFDGKRFCYENSGDVIRAEPVRWMVLPPVVSDSDAGEGTA